jgi:hypothetical protein
MERRGASRVLLQAPVIIKWTDASGAQREDVGRTRNVSASGAFLTSQALFPVGTTLSLAIHVPPLERNAPQDMRLHFRGKVIRLARKTEQTGFAVSGPFTLRDDLGKD